MAIFMLFAIPGGFLISSDSHTGTWEFAAGPLSVTPEKIQSQIFTGTENDYDARDEYNRPVKKASVAKELQNMFTGNVYNLMSKVEIFSIAKAQEILNRALNPAALAFARAAWRYFNFMVSAVISQTKRQSILTLLPFIFISLATILSLHFSYLIFTPKSRVAPLVLRC